MNKELIYKIFIDDDSKLHLVLPNEDLSMIYRFAKGIYWDSEYSSLHFIEKKEWSYLDWYKHILKVVKENCSLDLYASDETIWENIPTEIRIEITALN